MPIVLFRVDERLIHGQVVVGWGGPLHADRIVVADDAIAESPWEQELYCLGVPPEIEASFLSVAQARDQVPRWRDDALHRTIVLVRDVATLRRVSDGHALRGEEVNLGGIHHAAGREKLLPYLFLTPAEGQVLRDVAAEGVRITARDLPATRPVPLDDLLSAGH
jgi:mannose/fructose/N-acetylgalactosamine-specific phosphotransferase system component IIB